MQDAYRRSCSHFSTSATVGVPEGIVLKTILTGGPVQIADFSMKGHPRIILHLPARPWPSLLLAA